MRYRLILLAVLVVSVIVVASYASYLLAQYYGTSKNACSTPTPSPYVSEYCVINSRSSPNAITVDSKGNVWFVVQEEGDLGVLYSSNSTVRTFPIPTGNNHGAESWGIGVDNSRNLVWFSDYADNGIWSFNILTDHFTYYNISSSSFAFPQQLVIDPKGDVWFTESFDNSIGELTTTGNQMTYPLPSQLTKIQNSGPFGITENNNTFWFTDPVANSIGSLSVASNGNSTFHVYNMSNLASSPVGIAVDSEGNVWMTEHGPSLIAEFNPITRAFRSITSHIPSYFQTSLPYFVYIDASGNVWFNEHEGNAIGRFTPSDNSLVEYLIPTEVRSDGNISGALTMSLSPNGTPWFTEFFAGKVGKVNLQVPVSQNLSLTNLTDTNPISLMNGQKVTLDLKVSMEASQQVQLSLYLSTYNFSSPFVLQSTNVKNATQSAFLYNFVPAAGKGNFTSGLTIQDQHLAPGEYYLTLSEQTSNLIVSRVMEINAT
jgi:virginiamycin B lyase